MTKQEDHDLTSHGHTEATMTYNATQSENNLKTRTIDLPQLKTEREGHIEKGRRGRDAFGNQPPQPPPHQW